MALISKMFYKTTFFLPFNMNKRLYNRSMLNSANNTKRQRQLKKTTKKLKIYLEPLDFFGCCFSGVCTGQLNDVVVNKEGRSWLDDGSWR